MEVVDADVAFETEVWKNVFPGMQCHGAMDARVRGLVMVQGRGGMLQPATKTMCDVGNMIEKKICFSDAELLEQNPFAKSSTKVGVLCCL